MEVTDDDIDEELAEIARATKSTAEEARKKWEDMGLMAVIREGVMHRKAVNWLMENVDGRRGRAGEMRRKKHQLSPRVRRRHPLRRQTRPTPQLKHPLGPRAPRSSPHDP